MLFGVAIGMTVVSLAHRAACDCQCPCSLSELEPWNESSTKNDKLEQMKSKRYSNNWTKSDKLEQMKSKRYSNNWAKSEKLEPVPTSVLRRCARMTTSNTPTNTGPQSMAASGLLLITAARRSVVLLYLALRLRSSLCAIGTDTVNESYLPVVVRDCCGTINSAMLGQRFPGPVQHPMCLDDRSGPVIQLCHPDMRDNKLRSLGTKFESLGARERGIQSSRTRGLW